MLGGELSMHFLNVMLMTVLVAPLILWRYRRAVLARMQDRGGVALPLAPALRAVDQVPAATTTPASPPTAPLEWERRIRRRVFAAALASLVVPSLLLAWQYLFLGEEAITPASLFLIAGVTWSMAVPVFAVLTATPFWRATRLWLVTLIATGAAGVVLSMLQRPLYGKAATLDQAMNFVLFSQLAGLTLWLPLLFGLLVGARRVRGVAPLAFAGLLVFAIGPLLGLRVTQWLSGMQWSQGWVASGPGLDAGFIVLALPIGLLAWLRLKSIARAYEAKRFSDAQLLANSWWLIYIATRTAELVSVYPDASRQLQVVAVSAVAYLLFPFSLARTLSWAYAGTTRPAPRTLLVLRVFGDTRRTEALFDRIATRWQLFGPVTLIAAPDVVARMVDPGDVLRFATGDIGTGFVKSADDLARALAAVDRVADRDGRFRVSEFCCRDDTWQATVVELIEHADAVVMDLRGFTAQRRGCEFELRQLAERIEAGKVVLVVDGSTDRALLAQVVPAGGLPMRIVEVERGNGREADTAFVALLGAAG